MNKKLIRLTESDLHKIVKESVNRVLNEMGSPKRREMTNDWLGSDDGAANRRRFEIDKRFHRNEPWHPIAVEGDEDDPLEFSTAMGLANQNVHDSNGLWSMLAQIPDPENSRLSMGARARRYNGTIDSLAMPGDVPYSKQGVYKQNEYPRSKRK